VQNPIAIDEDATIYFALHESGPNPLIYTLSAINASGQVKWRFPIVSPSPLTRSTTISGIAIAGDRLYLTCWDGKVYCLSKSGDLKWTYQTSDILGNGVRAEPITDVENNVYFVDGDFGLTALSAEGIVKWRMTSPSFTDAAPALGANSVLYVPLQNGTKLAAISDPVAKRRVAELLNSQPNRYTLEQNYPNPFNPETEIRFQLPESSLVTMRIFNVRGQEIRTLVNAQYEAGYHSVRWDGKDGGGRPAASGIYLYQMQVGNFSEVKKMSLVP